MNAKLLADAVLIVHLAFVVFVVFGGLLALWRNWLAVLHLPALAWGIWIELSGRVCPLTPLEQHLRRLAAETSYEGGFLDHYVVPLLYPDALDRRAQVVLAVALAAWNIAVYAAVFARARRRRVARAH